MRLDPESLNYILKGYADPFSYLEGPRSGRSLKLSAGLEPVFEGVVNNRHPFRVSVCSRGNSVLGHIIKKPFGQ